MSQSIGTESQSRPKSGHDSTFEIRGTCPIDLHPLSPIKISTIEEVHEQVTHARKAQVGWQKLSFNHRARLLKRAGKEMLRRRQEVMELLHDEAGKIPGEMLLSEVAGPLQYIKDWISVLRPGLKPQKAKIPALAFPGKSGIIEKLPRGVVGIIAPWNFPLGNFFKPLFPALLCGNTVVLKPSEYSPRTAQWMVEILNEFLPENVVSCVYGYGETAQALIRSGIDAVTFTGSYATGRKVAATAAEKMIPVSLELGGKDAAIVLEDCDLDRTVAGIQQWALNNAGQACGAIDRVYVKSEIAEEFIQKLAQSVSRLAITSGDPRTADIGAMVNEKQIQIIEDQVQDAVDRGARLLCGGKRSEYGLWYQPTVLDQCNHSMKVMNEPTFGPVIAIARVESDEAAVKMANASEYGLNASVWSQDLKRASELASRLYVGTAFVNNHAFTGALASVPWTGTRNSGYGIANSAFAIQHYTRPRTLVVDRKKSADGWWFPMDADAEELGHCLADAQLGKIGAALRVPWLMFRRQNTVIQFIKRLKTSKKKPNQELKNRIDRLKISPIEKLHQKWIALTSRIQLRLPSLPWEYRWAQAATEALFYHPSKKFPLMVPEESKIYFKEFMKTSPVPQVYGFRAMLWAIGFSPLFLSGKLKLFHKFSVEDRASFLLLLEGHRLFAFRQVYILLKAYVSLGELKTSRFHQLVLERSLKTQGDSTSKVQE